MTPEMIISSKQNETIKFLRSLSEPKARKESGLFLAEGLRAVIQALQSQAKIEQLIFNPDELISVYGREALKEAETRGIPCLRVTVEVLQSLARKEKPQGIIALIRQNQNILMHQKVIEPSLWIGVEGIQNPGNLGTMLRISDAVGAKGFILLGNCTDPYDPAAVKASMGSIFTVPVYHPAKPEFIVWLDMNPDLKLIGTSDRGASNFAEFDYPPASLILMGSEREGLSQAYLHRCDATVAIPMEGACDSLNIAVATGIIAYQAHLQQRTSK